MADSSQLRQLLTNLMTNAIEAMEPGGRVNVKVSRVPDDGESSSGKDAFTRPES